MSASIGGWIAGWVATTSLALAIAAGCSEHAARPAEPARPYVAPTEPLAHSEGHPATDETEALALLDPATECGRAQICCRAFALAFDAVEPTACAGPGEVADEPDADAQCRRMTAGWREALERHPDADPPPECLTSDG